MQYEVFCSGEKVEDERETQVDRVDVGQLACALSDEPETTILVDVRSATEYGICSLKDSISESFLVQALVVSHIPTLCLPR